MFASLRVREFRIWFLASLLSNIGTFMQATALIWVVLTELTDEDAWAMGVTIGLQFAPPLLLVGLTGWAADRLDRRRLLLATQSALGITAVVIAVLILTGRMTLPLMLVMAVIQGIAAAFDGPVRQSFLADLVPRVHLPNAVSLNAMSFNTARLTGPAIAGILLALLPSGWVFLIAGLSFAATVGASLGIRLRDHGDRETDGGPTGLLDGFGAIWRRSDLVALFAIAVLMGAFALNFPLYASTMALEFGQDAEGFGLLTSAFGFGSLIGTLLSARRTRARLRLVIVGAGGFGVACLVSAAMPTYLAYAMAVVFIGVATSTELITANAYVQTSVDPRLRGRVMAVYLALLQGGTPVGGPVIGLVADAWGARASMVVGGGAGFAAAAVGIGWFLRSGRVHRTAGRRFRVEIDPTRPIEVPPEPEA